MFGDMQMATNPRYKNGNYRRKLRARMKARGDVCYLCGRPINWEDPCDARHPWSFVIDERIPVSRWQEFGYPSPEAVCMDAKNVYAAHRLCNAMKSNKTIEELRCKAKVKKRTYVAPDGEW